MTVGYFAVVDVRFAHPAGRRLWKKTNKTEGVAAGTRHVLASFLVLNECTTLWTTSDGGCSNALNLFVLNLFVLALFQNSKALILPVAIFISTYSSTSPSAGTRPTKLKRLSFLHGTVRTSHAVAAGVRTETPHTTTWTLESACSFVQIVL